MKILVTGSAGFIGFHTSQALLKRGDEVIGVDNFNDYYDPQLKRDRNAILEKFANFKLSEIDFSDLASLEQVFKNEKIDKICHLGAQAGVRYSITNPFVYQETNLKGTLNLLEMARHYQIKDFIFASSSSVYGGNTKVPFSETDAVDHPISLYAATKRANELMAYTYHHLYGLNCTGLRFFTVYGPWGRPDMALFKFTRLIAQNQPIEIYNNGRHSRDFTYIDDIVDGVVKSLDKAYPYEVINLGNNQPVELMYFIECIEKALGKKAQKQMLSLQQGDVEKTYANISKAKKLLDYQPKTDIQSGIKKFVSWYQDYYKNK
ncbi:MAG: hypothetical protein A2233_03790 [Candidatus Kerfeldbacteria bacterium RIFOXYA2_FULL_38_24]|uniref:NAD-dependent epimerase/dehydratase domain-containing protein n=1 Tax=Candidatus Kerfeldbacteria bacterium RIFOXYB2_FULL_38_14 TaxID=1798547 RepID=A0A1G2BA95_9BACT|nr:MAG: hypothetical protein A2233_03790 [Candidatus Kerfeldbacteria bacterium RIFOXYA2_FULL_38_24]OGY86104.1 MAG: hypothetical protein A2319_01435 [Candidatus Kerfeldbacteria bacterium RIFOXYB2_FULL_38_14]OGY89808.1 MAG: hypothetical protein A2458_05520 [Candidatus Kerfeldbacteria bacterium RIFOXYC2_FULL_38_9]